ncbi:MAG: hypothetical protein LBP22_15615, partial [Deltaproteobacteria bacterium]|nr:hypothetical protein [Deltaproteobacteria bacterium]
MLKSFNSLAVNLAEEAYDIPGVFSSIGTKISVSRQGKTENAKMVIGGSLHKSTNMVKEKHTVFERIFEFLAFCSLIVVCPAVSWAQTG